MRSTFIRKLGQLKMLRGNQSGVALVEFALMLPLFLGFTLAGLEMSNYILANNKTQRLATMTADLVAQSGAGEIGASEPQIYDLFNALDVSAQPFDLRNFGRIVITAIKGTDNNNDGNVENTILWQRFDGAYTAAPIELGCHDATEYAILRDNRTVAKDELLFHVQVTYRYQPLFADSWLKLVHLPVDFTRTAVFRARSKDFQSPTPASGYPPKENCATADGL